MPNVDDQDSSKNNIVQGRTSAGVQQLRNSPPSPYDCDTPRRSLGLINRLSGVTIKKNIIVETPIEATTTSISRTPNQVLLKDDWGSKRSRGYPSGRDRYYEDNH